MTTTASNGTLAPAFPNAGRPTSAPANANAESDTDPVAAAPQEVSPDHWSVRVPDLLQDRNRQFWYLQVVGFLGWAVATIAPAMYVGVKPAFNLAVLTGIVTGIALTAVLRLAYRQVWNRSWWVRGVVLVLGAWAVALLWQVSKNIALYEFYGYYFAIEDGYVPMRWIEYTRGTLNSFYIILCWSGLYAGIKYYRMLSEERARSLKAMSSAREAQLRMLRYQLNPHFLFNTLNAISTLILEQQTRPANDMVTRLSSFLRYSLDSDPMQRVDLEQELRALRLYLDIEQVRFEERLRLDFQVTEEARRVRIPSLPLQPLVENAIKYAIARNERGGTIGVHARLDGDRLIIHVEDDGPGVPDDFRIGSDSHGVGLRNTRDRLQQVYGDLHRMRTEAVHPQGLRVVIEVPASLDEEGAP